MPKPSTILHNTFVIERSYPVPPERVFAALADPSQKRAWFAAADTVEFQTDFRVGGLERVASRMGKDTPFPGVELESSGVYLNIVPGERVVSAATMSLGGRPISSALTTFELVATETGTDLIFTHQAAFFEGSDGPQMREHGWQVLLGRLGETLTAA